MKQPCGSDDKRVMDKQSPERTYPGYVVLLGSGERSPHIQKVYHWLFEQLDTAIHTAILETPAGFELNSDYVAGRIGWYLEERLQNFAPRITIVPARKRDTAFSPDDPAIVQPVFEANVLFMGPGSPTYAVRQLRDSLAWHAFLARHRLGAALIIASAATLALSIDALPVYEIYKVGEDVHWKSGLDFFGPYGLRLVFIPHWNNQEGGAVLDTSHCYMGQPRYEQLKGMLSPDRTIVGIDEASALVVDPAREVCHVMGLGGVTIVRGNHEQHFASGTSFAATEMGDFSLPDPQADIPPEVWAHARATLTRLEQEKAAKPTPPPEVLDLVAQRTVARQQREWAEADRLRDQIEAEGWQVRDTPEGALLEPR